MKVIVTGGSGKAGQYLVRELGENGHEVVNLDRVRANVSCPTIQLDLTDCGAVYDAIAQVKPEGVCHLAANPSPGGFPGIDIFHNNVMSSFAVMQAAGDLGVRRFIYGSSEMATGLLTPWDRVPGQLPFDETTRYPSGNAYALSKYMGEVIADSMSERFPDMSLVSLRINNIIPSDQYHVLQGRRDEPQHGMGNFWSYIDSRDVAGAFRAALEGASTGHEVFLIAAADTCSDQSIEALMDRYYGGYHSFQPGYGGFQSAFDCSKMTSFFGWTPRHSWRDEELATSD